MAIMNNVTIDTDFSNLKRYVWPSILASIGRSHKYITLKPTRSPKFTPKLRSAWIESEVFHESESTKPISDSRPYVVRPSGRVCRRMTDVGVLSKDPVSALQHHTGFTVVLVLVVVAIAQKSETQMTG